MYMSSLTTIYQTLANIINPILSNKYGYYLFIVISLSIITPIGAYTSNKSLEAGGMSKWFFINWACWCLPIWAIVTLYTKDVVFDGILYDIIMTLAFTIGIIYFTRAHEKMNVYNVGGVVLMLAGLVIYKLGDYFQK